MKADAILRRLFASRRRHCGHRGCVDRRV